MAMAQGSLDCFKSRMMLIYTIKIELTAIGGARHNYLQINYGCFRDLDFKNFKEFPSMTHITISLHADKAEL